MPSEVLDEDLAAALKQAKKKPRNFLLVVKGSKALKLIVNKKPIKAGEAQEAKKEAQGTGLYKGVCQGDGGVEMVFKIVGEEPTVKTVQFKELIAEQTGLTIKPRFELVTELAEVDDNSEDTEGGQQQATDTSATAPTQENAIPPAPPPPKELSPDAKALMAALNKIAPAIKDAVAANAERRNDLVGMVAKFKQEVAENQLEGAKETLKSLAGLLKELSAKSQSSTPTPPVSPPPTQTQPTQEQAQQTQNENPLASRWKQEFPKAESQYLEALKKADSKLASELKVVFAFATEQAEAGAYDRALKGLERLAPLIQKALATQGPGGAASEITQGIVEKRKFLVSRWNQIPKEIASDLSDLRKAIAQTVPDEDSEELVSEINEYLKDFWEDMRDEIDKAINSGDNTFKAALQAIGNFKAEVGQNRMVQHLESNAVGANLSVKAILVNALEEVEENLAG